MMKKTFDYEMVCFDKEKEMPHKNKHYKREIRSGIKQEEYSGIYLS